MAPLTAYPQADRTLKSAHQELKLYISIYLYSLICHGHSNDHPNYCIG